MSFKISSRFISTASSINVISVDKFSKLLQRIIQKLHIRDERLFTVEEETQLKSVFNLTDETLRLVIDIYFSSSIFIFIKDTLLFSNDTKGV
jgi:hypothetical protein